MEGQKQRVSVYLSTDRWKALRIAALESGTSASLLVEGMIRHYLAAKRLPASPEDPEGKPEQ